MSTYRATDAASRLMPARTAGAVALLSEPSDLALGLPVPSTQRIRNRQERPVT